MRKSLALSLLSDNNVACLDIAFLCACVYFSVATSIVWSLVAV
ncbi:hypothetical protein BMETH_1368_0 [methanotrophic bacterial endosymbiont of Bathymodiolus sp.]|nr:hypothetical protein BMETH_1368_0 [methanotrophic bacterial endosymbiont of Bathymodiolus sp.]